MADQRTLFFNSLSGTALYVVNIAVAFILSPILLRALGNSAYGLWELIMSVVGYMGLLDMGIGSAMVRYVAVADSTQDRQELGRIMSTSMVFFSLVGLFACVVFALLGLCPHLIIGEEASKIKNIDFLFYIFALNALFLFPLQVFLCLILGLQFHYFINFSRILLTIIKSISVYFYIKYYSNSILIFISYIELFYNFISFIIFYLFIYSKKIAPSFSMKDVSYKKFKELFVFGSKNLIMLISSRLQSYSVPIIISLFIGVGNIVYFAFPNRLIEYAKGFSLAIGYPLTPYFGSILGKGDNKVALQTAWLQTTFALHTAMCVMPIILWQIGEDFLQLWIGYEYAAAGRWVLNILITGLIVDILAVNAFRILTAQGRHGKSAALWLVVTTFSIPSSIIGGVVMGIEGVAIGAVTASIVGNAITLMFACASLDVPFNQYLNATVGRLLIPLTTTTICCIVLNLYIKKCNFFILFIQSACLVFLYATCVWIFSLEKDQKNNIKNIIRKLISRTK